MRSDVEMNAKIRIKNTSKSFFFISVPQVLLAWPREIISFLNLNSTHSVSMRGDIAFINRIENITPSQSANPLSKTVKNPRKIPYIHFPEKVNGEVTGSVAIKNAPNKRPPPRSWNRGGANLSGEMVLVIKEKIPTLRR